MNTFLNQNGNGIFGEIKPTFVKDLGIIFKDTMNKVFKKFPYNELFLDQKWLFNVITTVYVNFKIDSSVLLLLILYPNDFLNQIK